MKLLITRPAENSSQLADHLASMGYEAVLSPLIEIKFRSPGRLPLAGVQAFVVTSANGVEGLLHCTENRDMPVFAVGHKTAESAKAGGFETIFSAEGDVDTLAALITEKANTDQGALLHAGGARLAGDLKSRLEEAGFQYRREILYDAVDATSLSDEATTALAEGSLDGILLFSPHTAKVLRKVVERQGLIPHLKGVTAWCLSKNVALELTDLPFRQCHMAPVPSEASLLGQLTVKSENVTGIKKMDSDRIKGKIVSETPRQDKQDEQTSNRNVEEKTTEESHKDTAGSDIKKPLPDALTGRGAGESPALSKPRKSNAGKIAAALFFFFCLGIATWPILYPKVSPYLPQETRDIVQGVLSSPAADQKLQDRLAAFEKTVATQSPPAATLNLAPLKSSVQETLNQVAALNGRVNDLAEKAELGSTKFIDRLQDQESQIQSLSASIKALKEQVLSQSVVAVAEPSAQPVTAADPTPEILASLNGFQRSLDQLSADLTSVKSDLSASNTDASVQKDQLAALSATLQSRISQDTTQNAAEKEALVLLALGQLQRQSRSDAPFDGALRQAIATAPAPMQNALASLADVAKSGAVPHRDLTGDFSVIANDITQASRLPSSETWYGKTLHNIASLVKFRRVDDTDGESVDAVVARAEEKLQQGDLAGATAALAALTDAPADVAADWIAKARQRVLVDQTITSLLNKAAATAIQQNSSAN